MKSNMPPRLRKDRVLQAVVARLRGQYGGRLKRTVLSGSRARGDGRARSDYDIAIFLRGEKTDEDTVLADLNYDFLMDEDEDISVVAFGLNDWRRDTLIMRHIKRDGIEL